MKLLVVAYALPPLLYPQSIQIGRLLYYLPPDYQMYVVTADDKTCQHDRGFYSNITERFSDVITVNYTLFSSRIERVLFNKKPDTFLYWHVRAYRKIIQKWGKNKFDAIVTFSYPISSSLLGMWLKKYFNIKWFAFFSDPWADNPHANYKGITKWINSYLEEKVFKNADTLVFPSREMLCAYREKFSFIINKSACIEHSYDPALFTNNQDKKNNNLVVRYLGAFYGERTAEHFLAAIKTVLDELPPGNRDFLIEFIGGIERKHSKTYLNLLKKYGLNTVVKFSPPVPYLDSLRLMQASNVLVLIDAPIDGSVYFPSKLVDYIGSGRPILAITPKNGAAAQIIKEAGGWLVAPNDIPEMVKALHVILDSYKNGTLQQFTPSLKVAQEYTISNTINKFTHVLNGQLMP